jgi:DNA polymerase I
VDLGDMKVVIDIETNALINPTRIWVICCKNVDTGEMHVFRQPTELDEEAKSFLSFASSVTTWIGHNILGYDGIVLRDLLGYVGCYEPTRVIDTLIVSKMLDYSRKGHSVEDYGIEFGLDKEKYKDYSKYSKELETRCIRDVEITHKIYLKYLKTLEDTKSKPSLDCEHKFQIVINDLSLKGFAFSELKAKGLLLKVSNELKDMDKAIKDTFVPKLKYIRTVVPKETKYGTISLTSIPKEMRASISDLTVNADFSYCRWIEFNPNSHKQIIEVLNQAGWRPVDKTKTHIDTEREYNRLKHKPVDKSVKLDYVNKLSALLKTGWKVNETNLETLPPTAPSSARLLAKRILLESRRRTLTEWIQLVQFDGRVHGKFYGIGAWTQRMAHQNPNTANIPNEFDTSGKRKLLGKELRSLWCAPHDRLLVGVDAEGIQLRIFAHYINDSEFTDALVKGKKDDQTDPHSLNRRILGDVCKSRQAAKRYIYALLLGAGVGKLREILECDEASAASAYRRLLDRYTGLATLKETIIPRDAKRGWFVGLDGRRIFIPGDSEGSRRHLAMSGYLQNGEAVVMKLATLRFVPLLPEGCFLVNFVHDEWQTETPNNMEIALRVASLQADSLRVVGEELNLHCPLAGSYWNEELKDYTISTNWSRTH